MAKKRSWTDEELIAAVVKSRSNRQVLLLLGLIPAGGNYDQVKRRIAELKLDNTHFTGMGWKRGRKFPERNLMQKLETLLVRGSITQSHTLKKRLFVAKLKIPECELCGWAQLSVDGRIPVELDHINGDHSDNRLENLRILCPNCHSLQLTHRGKNKKVAIINIKPQT